MSGAQTHEYRIEDQQGVPILTLRGDIDIWNIDDFHGPLQQLLKAAKHGAIVELTEVTFAIGRVFGALQAAAERLAREGKQLVVVCPSNHFGCRIFNILQYEHPVVDDREKALSTLNK